jgi:hypothetical protein
MFEHLSKTHYVDAFAYDGMNNLIPATCSKETHYDLAIINHNVCLAALRDWNIDKRVFTSHGVIPDLEQPIPGADAYVAVSEEVQDSLSAKGFRSTIIRNPIDTEYFSPAPVDKTLKRILWMNNRAPNMELVEPSSKGCEYRIQTGWADGVKENIQWADLVVTSGRGAYEAMSCGKNVCIVNWCGCDGMVTPDTIYELRQYNCSGRRHNEFWTAERTRQEFEKYDPDLNMRPYIIENNDVEVIAEQYLRQGEQI